MKEQNKKLFDAVRNNNIDALKAALEAGADVNAAGAKYGVTALMFAAFGGHKDVVKVLLEAGAKVNATIQYGKTALMFAAFRGHKDVVKVLLEAEAKVNATTQYGKPALMFAAVKGHIEVVRALLDAGADVNAADRNGETALMSAAMEGHVKVVQALLDAGAEIDKNNRYGETALVCALSNGHKKTSEMLFEKSGKKVTLAEFGYTMAANYQCSRLLNYVGYKNEPSIAKAAGASSCYVEYNTFLPPAVIVAVGIIPIAIAALAKYAYEAIKGGEAQNAPEAPAPAR